MLETRLKEGFITSNSKRSFKNKYGVIVSNTNYSDKVETLKIKNLMLTN